MSPKHMARKHLLAAEIFGYSFAHYQERLGIGKVRFDRLMPEDAEKLERALVEKWTQSRVARELAVDVDAAASMLLSACYAIEVVDAKNPDESFRNAVRQVIQRAVTKGIEDDDSIEHVVEQICYRASDLSYLLEREGSSLNRYSDIPTYSQAATTSRSIIMGGQTVDRDAHCFEISAIESIQS